MSLNKAIAAIGVGLQSAFGTPLTNPTFAHGVISGSIFELAISQDRAPITSAARVSPQVDRVSAIGSFNVKFRAHSKSIGMWLYAAHGAKTVSGTNPYTHTITGAVGGANVLPYLTVFAKMDGGEIRSLQDCIVDSLELSWTDAGALEVSVSGYGTVVNFGATFTPTTDDSYSTYMMAAGGVFQESTFTTVATAPIKAGSFKVANGAETIILSASIVPNEVFYGRQDYDTSLTIVPATALSEWRAIATGTGSGTAVSQTTVYGGLSIKFVNGTDNLTIAATRVPFTCSYPDADPKGGHIELPLAGLPVLTAAGATAATVTLVNTQVSY